MSAATAEWTLFAVGLMLLARHVWKHRARTRERRQQEHDDANMRRSGIRRIRGRKPLDAAPERRRTHR